MFEHNVSKQFAFHSPEKKKYMQQSVINNNVDTNKAGPSSKLDAVLAEADNYFLRKDICDMTQQIEKLETTFSFKQISNKDDLVMLYTGLPNEEIFEALYKLLSNLNRNYYLGWKVESVDPVDQLFITLYKLRLSTPYRDIAQRFNISLATVTNIFVTWLHVLHEVLYETLMSEQYG
ncbi:hypothetical protein FQR65_LT16640 [Abscondita terminalis]|nr:hypothetical protein FQR65_LT16640 [Abscondita terminalis]